MQNKLDQLGRRKRMVRRPIGKRIRINDRVLTILEKLHWFGDLPTEYLYQFTRHLGRDRTGLVKVLGDLFHENTYRLDGEYFDLASNQGLVDRPRQQLRAENPLGNEMVHTINGNGVDVLKTVGRYVPNAFMPSPTWEHAHMQSTVMASIALGAMTDPTLAFIPQHRIIAENQPCFEVDGSQLKPDGICALERNGRRFYLFIECDRDTEPNRPSNARKRKRKGKYWIDTVRNYNRLIGDGLYKRYLGIGGGHHAFLLNITVSRGHLENMVEVVNEVDPAGNRHVLSQFHPTYGSNFAPPPVLPLLREPWRRGGFDDFVLVK